MRNKSIYGQQRNNANQLVFATTSHKSVSRWSCYFLSVCISWVEVVMLVQIHSFSFNSFDILPSDDKSEYNVDGYLPDECREHELSLTLLYNVIYLLSKIIM